MRNTGTGPTDGVPARLVSLDPLRGLAVAGMIVVNNPGDGAHVYPALVHAPWNGVTFADAVFPTFLFVVGASLAQSAPTPRRVARRVALLVALGLVVNGFPDYDLATLRYPGVLQRIALCYLVAALVVRLLPRWARVLTGAALLGGYWWLMTRVAVPGVGAGVLTPHGNLAGWVDRAVFGEAHLYRGGTAGYDPEGLLSTLPAVVTVLAGCWAGAWLRHRPRGVRTAAGLAVAAVLAAFATVVLHPAVPVNKRLWTPSFVTLTAAVSLGALAAAHLLTDVPGRPGPLAPFVVMGRNAIIAYVGADLLSGALQRSSLHGTPAYDWLYRHGFEPLLGPLPGSLAFAVAMATVWFGVLALLWHRRVFVRL